MLSGGAAWAVGQGYGEAGDLTRCEEGGTMDGAYSRLIPYVDGTSDKMQAALITMLHQIIENGLKEYDRGF